MPRSDSVPETSPLPIRRVALKEQACERIRALILRGALPSGATISETALAEALGISRTPVREALLQLAAEGLVDYSVFNGTRVHTVTDMEREEIFLLRRTLELLAVERVSRSGTPEQIDMLQEILDRQAQLAHDEDRSAFLEMDAQFHFKLAEFAGLTVTQKFLGHIRSMFYLMGLAAIAVSGRSRDVLREHQRVLDAIRAHDPEAATGAMAAHLGATQSLLAASDASSA